MKLTKLQIKEFIRQAIDEIKEGGPGSGKKKDDVPSDTSFGPNPDDDDVPSDASYGPNPFDEGVKKIKESRSKPMKTTVKEVKRWMKTLEENRYRKIVNADARRVAWFVNNSLSEDYDTMPESMRKKWTEAKYGKERHLAKEFIKSQKAEQKIRESIRKIIPEVL